MIPPRTPTKADDELDKIKLDLKLRWNLQFPERDSSWSPSKVKEPKPVGDQVLSRLIFLNHKDKHGLANAIKAFEKQAETVGSQWKFKPLADQNVIPRRMPSESVLSRGFISNRPKITDGMAIELMQCLLHILTDAVNQVMLKMKTNRDPHIDAQSSSIKPESLSVTTLSKSKPRTTKSKQSQLDSFFITKIDSEPERHVDLSRFKNKHPSSDEFDPGAEVSKIMEDEVMEDTIMYDVTEANNNEATPLYPNLPEDGDTYQTAPSTPSKVNRSGSSHSFGRNNQNLSNSDMFCLKRQDLVPLPNFGQSGKKRPLTESMRPPLSKKVTLGIIEPQSPKFYHVNHLSPIEAPKPEAPKPEATKGQSLVNLNQSVPISLAETRNIPNELRWSTSFESNASFSSITTSVNQTWTPNASFPAESAATSFNSSADTADVSDTFQYKRPLQTQVFGDTALRLASENSRSGIGTRKPVDVSISKGNAEVTESMNVAAEDKKASSRKPDEYLAEQIFPSTLLTPLGLQKKFTIPLRQLHEVTRVSMHSKLPLSEFSTCLDQSFDDYRNLWSSLGLIVKAHGKSLPEKSSNTAWERATKNHDGVSFTGDLKFSEQPGGPIFEFSLKPMKTEKSYRLARKFGGDRFCIVGMPNITNDYLPSHLKQNHAAVYGSITNRLGDTPVNFLGRTWRAFYTKPEASKKTRRGNQNGFNETKHRIYFFACDGHDFIPKYRPGEIDPRKPDRTQVSVQELLDWFMPFDRNQDQTCLKLFARLGLGVSSTTPTVTFLPHEIIRTRDARADAPKARRLNEDRKPLPTAAAKLDVKVMNDGCARISKAAALDICDMLGLIQVPCVFQGRIGGAKGVWMVEFTNELRPGTGSTSQGREKWIEITDSQQKFEPHDYDLFRREDELVRFEVHSFSKKLSSATLNFQLMPILANRGIDEKVFDRLLEEDLTDKVSHLEAAMEDGLALRKWNQDNNSVAGERTQVEGIEMQGGLPLSTAEKINWFVEHGFEPKNCRQLKDFLFTVILEYFQRLENRMNIGIGLSTIAFIIADPLGILEEDEIHLGFSTTFRDPKSRWEGTMLNDIDVLVARSPALLPSDTQKASLSQKALNDNPMTLVRAAFKPELHKYTDVIIFSSKGNRSLADKLSGGDYDGDRAWICWEPSLVDPFQNFPVPKCEPPEWYGMKKETTKVSDILSRPNPTDEFLRHVFRFNHQNNMLGSCTVYHESLCYSQRRLDDPIAIAIAYMNGYLVDRAKAGIEFDEKSWHAFLKSKGLRSPLAKPAYKNKDKAKPTNHLIDRLVFQVAKGVREDALGKFSTTFKHVSSWDEDLVRLYNTEDELSKTDSCLKQVLLDLKAELKKTKEYWSFHTRRADDDNASARKPNILPFRAVVEKCRADFLALRPSSCGAQDINTTHVLRRWERESQNHARDGSSSGYWDLLKASALFKEYRDTTMVWWVAGVELGEIKAMARGRGNYRVVVSSIFQAMKLDGKVVDGVRRREGLRGADDVEEEDEYGEWGWDG